MLKAKYVVYPCITIHICCIC